MTTTVELTPSPAPEYYERKINIDADFYRESATNSLDYKLYSVMNLVGRYFNPDLGGVQASVYNKLMEASPVTIKKFEEIRAQRKKIDEENKNDKFYQPNDIIETDLEDNIRANVATLVKEIDEFRSSFRELGEDKCIFNPDFYQKLDEKIAKTYDICQTILMVLIGVYRDEKTLDRLSTSVSEICRQITAMRIAIIPVIDKDYIVIEEEKVNLFNQSSYTTTDSLMEAYFETDVKPDIFGVEDVFKELNGLCAESISVCLERIGQEWNKETQYSTDPVLAILPSLLLELNRLFQNESMSTSERVGDESELEEAGNYYLDFYSIVHKFLHTPNPTRLSRAALLSKAKGLNEIMYFDNNGILMSLLEALEKALDL